MLILGPPLTAPTCACGYILVDPVPAKRCAAEFVIFCPTFGTSPAAPLIPLLVVAGLPNPVFILSSIELIAGLINCLLPWDIACCPSFLPAKLLSPPAAPVTPHAPSPARKLSPSSPVSAYVLPPSATATPPCT